jgi:transcriptional regulator with XRE-family HTH domain
MTLEQLGAESGVSPLLLVRIENGQCYLSASVLRRIARPLGISEIEILTYPRYVSALNRLLGSSNRKS